MPFALSIVVLQTKVYNSIIILILQSNSWEMVEEFFQWKKITVLSSHRTSLQLSIYSIVMILMGWIKTSKEKYRDRRWQKEDQKELEEAAKRPAEEGREKNGQ